METWTQTVFPTRIVTWRDRCRERYYFLLNKLQWLITIGMQMHPPDESLLAEAWTLHDYLEGDYLEPYAEWDLGGES